VEQHLPDDEVISFGICTAIQALGLTCIQHAGVLFEHNLLASIDRYLIRFFMFILAVAM
jgi:hypothetical protein